MHHRGCRVDTILATFQSPLPLHALHQRMNELHQQHSPHCHEAEALAESSSKTTRASKLTQVDGVLPCFCSFPTCQVGVAVFFLLRLFLRPVVATAIICAQCSAPQSRSATHIVRYRTPTAMICAQCLLPGPNCDPLRRVFPAGPQPADRMSEEMPERMSDRMSHRPKRMSEEMLERTPQRM